MVMSWRGRLSMAVMLILATLALPVAPMICALTTCPELVAVSRAGVEPARGVGEAQPAAPCHDDAQPSSTSQRRLSVGFGGLGPATAHQCDHPPVLTSSPAAAAVRVPPAILIATLDGQFPAVLATRPTHALTPAGTSPVPRPAATMPPVLRI